MNNNTLSARFISIEGVDGAGKSTHVTAIIESLRRLGHEVVHTREPGGTPMAERLRELALYHPMSAETEAMLMFASRKDNIESVIRPALERGAFVVSDRFTDSSWAYQGGGKGVSSEFLGQLEKMTVGDLRPGLTFLFDLPVEVSLARLQLTGKTPDKFESQDAAFFHRVREAYQARARANPAMSVIDSDQTIERIAQDVQDRLGAYVSSIPRAGSKKRSAPGA